MGRRFLLLIGMMLMCGIIPGAVVASSVADKAYLPLARAHLHIDEGRLDEFMNLVEQFSKEAGLVLQNGAYPKDGRIILNSTIKISDEIFFHFDNFHNVDEININAYSHEDSSLWVNHWENLLNGVLDRFGPGSVVRIAVKP